MTAKDIWAITWVAVCATMLINLAVFVWTRQSPDARLPPPIVNTIIVASLVVALLRIWSIGLLYRRAFDLYVISIACWLGLQGIRASDGLHPPGPFVVWFVLLAGLVVDAVQVRVLRSAISRNNNPQVGR